MSGTRCDQRALIDAHGVEDVPARQHPGARARASCTVFETDCTRRIKASVERFGDITQDDRREPHRAHV